MKIQFASDLHLDLLQERFPGYRVIEPAEADVLVLAGDIHRAAQAIDTFADWPVPVIYVHGNHEAYHQRLDGMLAQLRERARGSRVHFLERDALMLDGVRFLGCCLWTDYALAPFLPATAMQEAERMLMDHRAIRTPQGTFRAADALEEHRQSRRWLESMLNVKAAGPTVVVSHHAPHPRSIHARFAGSIVNAAFVSDLTPLLAQADAWIHGHVHDSFDYEWAGARVVANPRGYARNWRQAASPAALEWENPAFDSRRVIKV